uniref:Baculoviral IAP repeat-containing protein 2-like isoform X2 n=1 Tax=Crassostrea virginica TaxID=6565 RepID=A0A8B8B3J8_CRAVI|nr:baculoviral IAP repeat-containing protein 2-like isoform X2 [Crassostrea virginica]
MSAFQHIESMRSRMNDSGMTYEELQNILVESGLYSRDDFERVLKEHKKTNDSLPSLEEFEELHQKMKVQLTAQLAERTLALKKSHQKLKKKNQQLVESQRESKDRLRQQRQQHQQALQQERKENERLKGLLQVERRSKQELEDNLDQGLQKVCANLFIQAQRVECKVCLVEEVQVLFLPCRHLVTCEKCANCLDQCSLCRENIQNTIRVFLA